MDNKSFVAIITPVSGCAAPPPLGIWGGGAEGFPTPPIVIVPPEEGKPPVFIWGGGNEPWPTPPIVIVPPEDPADPPLVIWGPSDPRPAPPIANVPGAPETKPPTTPPGIWGGANEPWPTNPIVIPKPPEGFPAPPASVVKPPPETGGWGYADPPGVWFFVPGSSGTPSPKTSKR